MQKFPPISSKCLHLLHGGDYNPEQWLNYPAVLAEDLRLMQAAHCNTMSVGIFSWVMYEPEEGVFQFAWLDRVLDNLAQHGCYAVLATPSGSKPAWLSQQYPEVCRVTRDGRREPHQRRHNHCYTSPVYREKVRVINTQLAVRYKDHPALLLWHVSNEYSGECHCPLCYAAFRAWLRARYASLAALNDAWWSAFWSHRFTAWEQIAPVDDAILGLVLDWQRFVTDQTVDFMQHEIAALKAIAPALPVTTNLMGTYPGLNPWKCAPHLDVIAWDNYPDWHGEQADWRTGMQVGFLHDLNRSLKGGQPFMLMESTPSMTNWRTVSRSKRPGMHVLSSLQAVAHGADTVLYFQWRKGRGGSEKFHGAVVDHVGHEHTRVFRDVAAVGQALEKLDALVGTSVPARAALVYDWENCWALSAETGPRNKDKNYTEECTRWYQPLWARGIACNVIDMTGALDNYDLVIAPMAYMLRAGFADTVRAFVARGGVLVTTYFSGLVDEHDLCFLGGFPGPWRPVLGVWAEETDVFHETQPQSMVAGENDLGLSGTYAVRHYADIIHAEGARVLATYGHEFYAGQPALTCHHYERGAAYYVAARTDERLLDDLIGGLAVRLHLPRALETALPPGVSAQVRTDGARRFVFVMNFNPHHVVLALGEQRYCELLSGATVTHTLSLPAYGVAVLES